MRAKKVKPTQLEIITEFAKIDKKINRPQVVNFIKNNANDLYIRKEGSFDSMVDGFSYGENIQFEKVDPKNIKIDSEYNIIGYDLTLLKKGNYIRYYEDDFFIGYYITNCVNYVKIAILK